MALLLALFSFFNGKCAQTWRISSHPLVDYNPFCRVEVPRSIPRPSRCSPASSPAFPSPLMDFCFAPGNAPEWPMVANSRTVANLAMIPWAELDRHYPNCSQALRHLFCAELVRPCLKSKREHWALLPMELCLRVHEKCPPEIMPPARHSSPWDCRRRSTGHFMALPSAERATKLEPYSQLLFHRQCKLEGAQWLGPVLSNIRQNIFFLNATTADASKQASEAAIYCAILLLIGAIFLLTATIFAFQFRRPAKFPPAFSCLTALVGANLALIILATVAKIKAESPRCLLTAFGLEFLGPFTSTLALLLMVSALCPHENGKNVVKKSQQLLGRHQFGQLPPPPIRPPPQTPPQLAKRRMAIRVAFSMAYSLTIATLSAFFSKAIPLPLGGCRFSSAGFTGPFLSMAILAWLLFAAFAILFQKEKYAGWSHFALQLALASLLFMPIILALVGQKVFGAIGIRAKEDVHSAIRCRLQHALDPSTTSNDGCPSPMNNIAAVHSLALSFLAITLLPLAIPLAISLLFPPLLDRTLHGRRKGGTNEARKKNNAVVIHL